MEDFHQNIKNRLAELKQGSEFDLKKRQIAGRYARSLVDSTWKEVKAPDDFQTAFLDLLHEKYPGLLEQFQKPLEQRFYDMYRNSHDEAGENYKPQAELEMHSIQLPSEILERWQLMYEMKSDDTIFHVEFEGWTYNMIGITH